MKISKIPGLGNYGVFVDDVNFNHITDEEWMEIGQLYLKNLVVIIRKTNLDYQDQQKWVRKFGGNRDIVRYDMAKRYGCKVVKGGKPGRARNNGAKFANGELLLFLDADL